VRRLPFVAEVELAFPPGKQIECPSGSRDFIAEIVGPAAVGIDIVEMLMKIFREEPGDNLEVFVVMRGEPVGVALGGFERAAKLRGMPGNFNFAGKQH
jgi:hypothetical protein